MVRCINPRSCPAMSWGPRDLEIPRFEDKLYCAESNIMCPRIWIFKRQNGHLNTLDYVVAKLYCISICTCTISINYVQTLCNHLSSQFFTPLVRSTPHPGFQSPPGLLPPFLGFGNPNKKTFKNATGILGPGG